MIAGIYLLQIAPASNVQIPIAPIWRAGATAITTEVFANWITIPVLRENTPIEPDVEDMPAGRTWSMTIEMVVLRPSRELIAELARTIGPVVAKITDNNAQQWLLGLPTMPAKLFIAPLVDKEQEGRYGIKIILIMQQGVPPLIVL